MHCGACPLLLVAAAPGGRGVGVAALPRPATRRNASGRAGTSVSHHVLSVMCHRGHRGVPEQRGLRVHHAGAAARSVWHLPRGPDGPEDPGGQCGARGACSPRGGEDAHRPRLQRRGHEDAARPWGAGGREGARGHPASSPRPGGAHTVCVHAASARPRLTTPPRRAARRPGSSASGRRRGLSGSGTRTRPASCAVPRRRRCGV